MNYTSAVTLLAVFALVFSPATAGPLALPTSGPTEGWTIEAVGLFGGSAEPSLALDSLGVPYVLYCPPGDELFATRTPSGWESEHLVFTVFGGGCGQIAFGPKDVPHVTTLTAAGILEELYGTRENGVWGLSPYPGGSLEDVNAMGEPQVVAFEWQAHPSYVWSYRTFVSGNWTSEEFETFSSPSLFGDVWASLALDAEDQPRILYYDDLRGDVRYAVRDDAGWHVEIVEHIGALNIVGREGSLALDSEGLPHAAYTVRTGAKTGEVRYATLDEDGWTATTISPTPPAFGGGALAPSVAVGPEDVVVLYRFIEALTSDLTTFNDDLVLATWSDTGWSREIALDGHRLLGVVSDPSDDEVYSTQFPTMVMDACGNPHVATYLNWRRGASDLGTGVYYATKGSPCGGRSVAVDVDPDTLNLKSKGRWVTASITANDAGIEDVDPASLALNGVPAAKWSVEDDALVAKFDRAAFAATVAVGDSVEVTLTGTWSDGSPFAATDAIRVIDPGGGPAGLPHPIKATPLPLAVPPEPLALPAWRQSTYPA